MGAHVRPLRWLGIAKVSAPCRGYFQSICEPSAKMCGQPARGLRHQQASFRLLIARWSKPRKYSAGNAMGARTGGDADTYLGSYARIRVASRWLFFGCCDTLSGCSSAGPKDFGSVRATAA